MLGVGRRDETGVDELGHGLAGAARGVGGHRRGRAVQGDPLEDPPRLRGEIGHRSREVVGEGVAEAVGRRAQACGVRAEHVDDRAGEGEPVGGPPQQGGGGQVLDEGGGAPFVRAEEGGR
ncbi:hypothetical protein B277_14189 [Janibacter hoylei PVAS-1]|uniref:Uncharacterized protein n=1 Tax=Janibacter hoylei PVAS-1 TaxID=1210046 RepID=K1ELP3_9MICO|nr:hypothetical protein B277_14189 [Janibacter hoylei PVAS-1]